MSPTRIHAYTLDWLIQPEATAAEANDQAGRLPYAIPPEIGQAWVDCLSLRDGIVLYRATHDLTPSPAGQLIHLMDVSLAPPEPVFNAQIWLSGLGCHREYWHGGDQAPAEIIAGPGRDTFRFHQNWRCNILIEGGVVSEMRSVDIPESTLSALLSDTQTELLLSRLGLSRQRPTVVRAIAPHISSSLLAAISEKFVGPARTLYAQAQILEYLAKLLVYVSEDKGINAERRHRSRILELHEYLIALEGRLPTLSELAKDFGLSARRLNEEFTAEFGKSVYNFINEHRLEQAHAVILAGGTPMKVPAERLGYSHVNHFISAFRRKFGYAPGKLRKSAAHKVE